MKKMHLSSFWKTSLSNTVGTIIGIVLTFGTSSVIQRCESASSGQKTALMVIHNIDEYCHRMKSELEDWAVIDSINGIVYNAYPDQLENISDSTALKWLGNLLHRQHTITDNTAGNIFGHNIDTWENIDDNRFIENAGRCFDAMDLINDFVSEKDAMQNSLYDYYMESLVLDQEYDETLKEHFCRVASDRKVRLYMRKFNEYYFTAAASCLENLEYHNHFNKKFMEITETELEAMDFEENYQ